MQDLDKYIIKYSNHFEFNGHILAFRKQLLFDIGEIAPKHLPVIENSGSLGWYITSNKVRKWLSKSVAKELASPMNKISINVSDLNWDIQIRLDECFNLN